MDSSSKDLELFSKNTPKSKKIKDTAVADMMKWYQWNSSAHFIPNVQYCISLITTNNKISVGTKSDRNDGFQKKRIVRITPSLLSPLLVR
jgi:hypothetical protein